MQACRLCARTAKTLQRYLHTCKHTPSALHVWSSKVTQRKDGAWPGQSATTPGRKFAWMHLSPAIGNARASVQADAGGRLPSLMHEINGQRNAGTGGHKASAVASSNVSEYGGARVLISSCCTRTHEQEMRAQRCNMPQIENTSTSTPASAAAQQPTLVRR